jgi:lysophospholipase L1-like esterase
LPIGSGFCGPALSADFTTGLLEYRATDKALRWTAPGDTAGAWTQITRAGWWQLESATADKFLRVGVKNLTTMPVADQSVTVSGSGSMNFGWNAIGLCNRAMNLARWLCPTPVSLGIGGSTTADVVEQLSYAQAQASGLGWDFIMVSTNDVTNGTAAATITANLQTIYDARRALGRKLVIVENTARWGVNTSTPLTAGQITTFDAVRSFNQTYAAQHDCLYVDSYLLTYDSGFSDRRPAAGMLRDTVHPTDNACQLIAAELYRLLKQRIGPGRFRTAADANTFANGVLNGTGGSLATGASGQVANGWTVGRATGTDGTATCSVIDRTDGGAGKMQRIQATNTTAGWMEFTALSAQTTLAALGLAVGDTVYYEIEYEVANPVALQNIAAQAFFTGASPTTALTCNLETSNVFLAEAGTMRTPPAKIPAGTTNVRPTNYMKFGANGSADVKFGVCRIVKVG